MSSERIHIVKRTRSTQSLKKPESEQKTIQPLQLSPFPRKTTQKNMFHQSKQAIPNVGRKKITRTQSRLFVGFDLKKKYQGE